MAKNPLIYIDFVQDLSKNELKKKIINRINKDKLQAVDKLLVGFFHKNLSILLIKKIGLKPTDSVQLLDQSMIKKLCELIKKYPVHTQGVNAGGQVKVGGYDVSQFDENLQSKLVNNLYVVGECLDVDGVCGGYNLAWAWSSGAVAGASSLNA